MNAQITIPAELGNRVANLDGRQYSGYSDIRGTYDCGAFTLQIERVQRDPFASPTLVRIHVPISAAGFSADLLSNSSRRIGLCDYLARQIEWWTGPYRRGQLGSGNSGCIEIARMGQEIIERSSVQVIRDHIEARVYVGLPGRGRRIRSADASGLLVDAIPEMVSESLTASSLNGSDLTAHVNTNEDQDVLRAQLLTKKLVAFVENGSILPRESGSSDLCMSERSTIPFKSPETLAINLRTAHRGTVSGMGIPEGVTMVTGGAFHGKSTLLQAIERGIYNHVPGDGREGVVTAPKAVKIRAEEGRSIRAVDIRPFIRNLPGGVSSEAFTTNDASGSTSQAANVAESIELGATALLLDEDSSAANFLSRDHRMEQLIPTSEEPISPFSQHVQDLHEVAGISTLIVSGGSSAFLDVADSVLRLKDYVVHDVTESAKQVGDEALTTLEPAQSLISRASVRVVEGFDLGERPGKVRVRGRQLQLGSEEVSLDGLEQLAHEFEDHATSVGYGVALCAREANGDQRLVEILKKVEKLIDEDGLDVLSDRVSGKLVRPRILDVAAAVNRCGRLRVTSAAS